MCTVVVTQVLHTASTQIKDESLDTAGRGITTLFDCNTLQDTSQCTLAGLGIFIPLYILTLPVGRGFIEVLHRSMINARLHYTDTVLENVLCVHLIYTIYPDDLQFTHFRNELFR